MPTAVQNLGSSAFTFPAPWKGVLPAGKGCVLNKTEAEVLAVVGALPPGTLKLTQTNQAGGYDDAKFIPGSGEAVDGSITADDLAASAVTTAKLADAAVTAAKLAPDANLASLIAAGLAASVLVDHADASPKEILASDAAERAVLVIAICTESLAGDNEPLFDIGAAGDPDSILDQLVLAGATAGDVFVGAGVLPAGEALIATLGTGGSTTNDAGAFAVTVLALPTAV